MIIYKLVWNSGYLEVGCHSRRHPSPSSDLNYDSEITGNIDDLINNLTYISNHKNIWYATVGHIFLYRFGQTNYVSSPVVGVTTELKRPLQIELSQNHPNLFNPITNISSNLPETEHVKLSVLNTLSERIVVLVKGVKEARFHIVKFDASQSSS